MRSSYCIVVLVLSSLLFVSSCKKTVVVIPDACLTSDKTEVQIGDSVTFTNCSKAELSQLMFFKGEVMPNEQNYFLFDENGTYKKAFGEAGTWTAMVRAINKNAPVKESRIVLMIRE